MRHRRKGIGVFGHGTRAKAPERTQLVIHDDSAGGGDIKRECRRNPHDMLAAPRQFGGQRAAFGTEHIGRPQGMGKAREVVGAPRISTPTRLHPLGSLSSLRLRQW